MASEFADSDKVVVADVDCTGAGEPLCERFGVEGFPTIKSFSPPDSDGEDYEGGRSLEELRAFALTLGPGCSASTKEACSPEALAELEQVMSTPPAELLEELKALKKKLADSQAAHDELLKSLQAQYEASEEAQTALKKEVKPRVKLLSAATASVATPAGSTAKDEV